MSHTPGPWHIEDASYGQIICAGKVDVAVVRNADELPHHANARLIAVAPDLLNALKSMLRHVERARESDLLACDDTGPEDMARDAISKAEGR